MTIIFEESEARELLKAEGDIFIQVNYSLKHAKVNGTGRLELSAQAVPVVSCAVDDVQKTAKQDAPPTFDRVQGVIARLLNIDRDAIELDSRLVFDLGMDSLTLVEFHFELDQAFAVNCVEVEAIERCQTVGEVVAAIEMLLAERAR